MNMSYLSVGVAACLEHTDWCISVYKLVISSLLVLWCLSPKSFGMGTFYLIRVTETQFLISFRLV